MRRRSHLLFFFLLFFIFRRQGSVLRISCFAKTQPHFIMKNVESICEMRTFVYSVCVCISDQIKPYFYAAQPADIPNWTGLHRNCIEISVSRTNLYKRLHNLYRQFFRSKYSPSINISREYAYLIDMHIRSRACIKINYD